MLSGAETCGTRLAERRVNALVIKFLGTMVAVTSMTEREVGSCVEGQD